MALVINPFFSGQASGKVGSLVASRNRTGAIIRQNAKPVNPRSPSSTLVRYNFVKLSNLFLKLDTARVNAWNDFGDSYTTPNKLGSPTNLTGLNWFLALNSRLDRAGVSIHLSPPLNPEPSFTPFVSVAQTAASNPITISFNVSVFNNRFVWVYGTSALTKTRRFKSGSMRLLTLIQTASVAQKPVLIPAANLTMDTSSYQFESLAVDENGRATAPLRFTVFPVNT